MGVDTHAHRGRSRRLLIAGGGTGGHLFPGVAVAEAWLQWFEDGDVVFVGSRRGLEARVVPDLGYRFCPFDARRLKNAGLVERARTVVASPGTVLAGARLVRELAPDVVLGVGGFVSGPPVLGAALLRLPCAIAEQNALPGLTNRLLARAVRRVYTAFPEAEARLPRRKVRLLGNPVRQAFRDAAKSAPEAGGGRSVLVLGGSQGARALNERLPLTLAAVARRFPDVRVRHQAGRGNGDAVRAAYTRAGLPGAVVDEFIVDVAGAMVEADLVIARAGATTVAELACVGRPALFVPFPFAADDHQAVNAASLVDAGAARLVRESAFEPAPVAELVAGLFEQPATLREMGRRARTRGRPDAAADIVADLARLAYGAEEAA